MLVPMSLEAPWLDGEHIRGYGWYPVPDGDPRIDTMVRTPFGYVPALVRGNYRPGSIIIFFDYVEWFESGFYRTDRFLRVDQEDIEAWKRGERDLLPNGIVVPPPEDPVAEVFR